MIELAFFFHYISDLVLNQVNSRLYLQKACLANTTTEKSYKVCYIDQDGLSRLIWPVTTTSYYRWAMLFLCVFYVSLATSWSDISGRRRRPLVFIAIFGQIMQSICGLLNHFFNSSFIVTFIFNSIFEFIGGINMMFVVAQIYICETVAVENRTMRLGLLWVVRLVCQIVGYQITNHLVYDKFGFYYSYALCLILSIIARVLAALRVYDKFIVPEEQQSFWKLFDVTRIAHSFKLVFKESLGKKRQLVLLLLIAYVLVYCVYEGENGSASYIIITVLRSLDGSLRHYSSVLVAKNLASIFNTLFCCVILSKCLKIRDVSIGIFASICNLIGIILYFFVGQTWHLYIATMLNAFHGVILFTGVSFLTKFFDGKEFGRLFGVLNIFFCLVLICARAYVVLVAKTTSIYSYSPAVYIGSLFLNVAVLVLYCISFMFWRLASDPEL
ncbi:uncharacterized protein LOC135838960 [Planococcus citri]|uniref:uncharacterized protein LOC135838960 n=1 Tax=Planococcus citri TaxID=170843 RepID=UPI0031F7EBE4